MRPSVAFHDRRLSAAVVAVCSIVIASTLSSCASRPPVIPSAETRVALDAAWASLARNEFASAAEAFASIADGDRTSRETAEALRGEALARFALGDTELATAAFVDSIRTSPSDVESSVARAFASRTLSLSDSDMAALAEADDGLALRGMPAWSRRAGLRGRLDAACQSGLDPAAAAEAAAGLGAVTEWRSSGPYPNPSGGGLATPFVDEPAGVAAVATLPIEAAAGLVVPSEYLGEPVFSVFYLGAEFTVERPGSYAVIADRSDAAVKVWIDGDLVMTAPDAADGDEGLWARVELGAGTHAAVVKLASMEAPGSFRLFVEEATTSADFDAAAAAAFASIGGTAMASAGPAIGILAATYRAAPTFERAFWLSTALALSGHGAVGAEVARALSAGDSPSYLADWAEYRALSAAGDYPEARAAMARIPFGAGFAPRDDQEMSSALSRKDWAEAIRLADASSGAEARRLYADAVRAIAALGSKSDGFAAYRRFGEAHPGYGELARKAYAMGGLGMGQSALLADWARGDYVFDAKMALFSAAFDGGGYAYAYQLGAALAALAPWDASLALRTAQAGYFAGAVKYEQYIATLEKLMESRPGSEEAVRAALDACSGVVESIERAEAAGASLSEEAKRLRSGEATRLKRLAAAALSFDPSDYPVRLIAEADLGLDGAARPAFLPEEAIARYEASGVAPSGDVAVVRDGDTRVFFPDGGTRQYRSYVLKVLSKAGLEAEGTQYYQPLPGGDAALKRAYTRKPDGRVVYAEVAGGRVNYTGLEVGDYLVMEYVANGSRKGYFEDDFWLDAALAGYGYVFERDLRVLYPSSLKPAYVIHGDASSVAASDGTPADGVAELRFEVRRASPAMRVLPQPDYRDAATWVDVSSLADWSSVAEWYRDLASGAAEPTPYVRGLAARLTEGARDEDEAVRRLFEYASSAVRYEDLAFQYSAHVPEPAAAVAKAGAGDCKDKSALLSALLASIGVESRYALSEPSYRGPYPYLPSARFSHAIVLARRGDEWLPLDPTGSFFTYPDMPSSLVGTRALPIPAAGEEPARELTVLEQPSRFGSVWTVMLDLGRSSTRAEAVAALRGDEAAAFRSAMASGDEGLRRSIVEAYAASYLPGSSVVSYSVDGERTLMRSPLLRVAGSGPSSLTRQGTKYAVNLSWMTSIGEGLLYASRPGRRDAPLTVGGGELESPWRQTFIVSPPDGFALESLPRSETLSFGAATVRFTYARSGDRIVAEREYLFPSTTVQPEDVAALRDFASRLRAKESELITLTVQSE